jgi:hypothetical protein
MIEINDTLRINRRQGFPPELDISRHMIRPYEITDVAGTVYKFTAKPKIRVYHAPPVRNFLVEELGGKWIYWGLCLVHTIQHDYKKQETAGTFEIIRLNTPPEMRQLFELIDMRPDLNYFD